MPSDASLPNGGPRSETEAFRSWRLSLRRFSLRGSAKVAPSSSFPLPPFICDGRKPPARRPTPRLWERLHSLTLARQALAWGIPPPSARPHVGFSGGIEGTRA